MPKKGYLEEYIKQIGKPVAFLFTIFLVGPFGLTPYIGYVLITYLLLFKSRILINYLDRDFIWILFFSISYTLFDALGPHKGVQFLIVQFVFPPIFYLLGKYLVVSNINYKQLVILLIIVAALFSSTSLLSIGKSLLQNGFVAAERGVPNFWTGRQALATGLTSSLIYPLVLPGIILSIKKQLKSFEIILLTSYYIIILLCSFRMGSRTALAITAISIIFGFIFVIRSQSITKNIKFISSTILLIILFFKFIPLDLNAEYLSVLGNRLQDGNASSISTAGNRTGLWHDAYINFKKSPLGWPNGHLAHNTWLDIARVSGIIPLFFFIINNISLVMNIKKIFNLNEPNIGLTTTFILYFLATFLLFFGEPIILGNFYVVTIFFFYQGILKQYLIKLNLST